MPGTYYDPTVSYASGGLDRETGQNYPAALYQRLMDMLEFMTGGSGTWTDFTPTLQQNGVGVAATVTYARYAINGKTAKVQIKLDASAAGTVGTVIQVASIPAAIAPARTGPRALCGVGLYADDGTALYVVAAVFETTTTIRLWGYNVASQFGITPSIAIAANDSLVLDLAYELA